MTAHSTTTRVARRTAKVVRLPRRAVPDPALERERRELRLDWAAWRRERDRLAGETAAHAAWGACLRRRERDLAARLEARA